jgi:hypothetical protein
MIAYCTFLAQAFLSSHMFFVFVIPTLQESGDWAEKRILTM